MKVIIDNHQIEFQFIDKIRYIELSDYIELSNYIELSDYIELLVYVKIVTLGCIYLCKFFITPIPKNCILATGCQKPSVPQSKEDPRAKNSEKEPNS